MNEADSWDNDLPDHVPPQYRDKYRKIQARFSALDPDDEVVQLAWYFSVNMRVGIDCAERVERAALATCASQKDAIRFAHDFRFWLRLKRLENRHRPWLLYLLVFLTLFFGASWLTLEIQTERRISNIRTGCDAEMAQIRAQEREELDGAISLTGQNAQCLRSLADQNIRIQVSDWVYGGTRVGIALWSASASKAQLTTADGQTAGAIYFSFPNPPTTAANGGT